MPIIRIWSYFVTLVAVMSPIVLRRLGNIFDALKVMHEIQCKCNVVLNNMVTRYHYDCLLSVVINLVFVSKCVNRSF